MFKNDQKGFTLVELTVVIAIIILLSGLVLTNYRVGEREYALLRSAQKLAQDLRRAQKMAMASETLPAKCGGEFSAGGYGIYFVTASNSYILFADCDDNGEYDLGPEKIEEIFLESKIKISTLSSDPFSLNITFFPPDPTIIIKPSANPATITLKNDGKTKTVKINTAGLIEID